MKLSFGNGGVSAGDQDSVNSPSVSFHLAEFCSSLVIFVENTACIDKR